MAELATIARPYAEALFRATDASVAPSLIAPLRQLAQVAAEPRLRAYADNPKVSAEQVSSLILGVLSAPLPAAVHNLLQVVLENGRLGAFGEIAAQYQALVDARAGVSQATVYSAFEISAAQLADITAALARRFGRTLDTRVVIEPELIGGVRVVVGDEVLDTSVRAKLEQMRTALAA